LANRKKPAGTPKKSLHRQKTGAKKTDSTGNVNRKTKQTGINSFAVLFVILAVFAAFGIYLETISNAPEEITAKAALAVSEEALLEVSFIDVGQGQSILIKDAENAVLIDAGEAEYGETVSDFVKSAGVDTLDLIIASHPHSDHIGGLPAVMENVAVREVRLPIIPDDKTPTTRIYENFLDAVSDGDIPLTETSAGDEINIGAMRLKVLSPEKNAEYNDLNDYSAVIMLSYGDTCFLFTGDAEKPAESILTESGYNLSADVLAVGHHGSSNSSTENFLAEVKPQIAVISCGKDNDYGHPTAEALARLGVYTDKIYRTDIDQTVVIITNGKDIKIKTEAAQGDNNRTS
jgi:beta-lactamase superfamily II metal-dependent hydrolase